MTFCFTIGTNDPLLRDMYYFLVAIDLKQKQFSPNAKFFYIFRSIKIETIQRKQSCCTLARVEEVLEADLIAAADALH
jgi:hypothetical protein